MNYKSRLLLLLAIGLTCGNASAQADIHFSQFYETSILRNPALTGVFDHDYKVTVYGRSQWSSVAEAYQTLLLDAQTKILVKQQSNDFVSVGLLAYNDKAGALDSKITGIYPSLCYNKSVNGENTSYLSVGFTGGYVQYSFDPTKATFDYQFQGSVYNPANPSLESIPYHKMNVLDVGAGVNFNSSPGNNNKFTYLIGLSGYHFSQPMFSYYNRHDVTQNIRWNANASLLYDVSPSILLQVHGNYAQQDVYGETMIGALIRWRALTTNVDDINLELSAGAMVRINDAFIPVFKIKYRRLWMGVSYDVNTSQLKPASNLQGGPEITIGYAGDFLNWGKGYKKTVCPRF